MNVILFAMLGGSIGWGVSRMICTADGRLALITNILVGICGALLAEWLLVPLLGESARRPFAVSASLVSLGAVVPLTGVAILRQALRR